MTQHPKFGAVCFDCDSTLTRIEGIDELARRGGCEAKIASMTEAAIGEPSPLAGLCSGELDIFLDEDGAACYKIGGVSRRLFNSSRSL